MSRLGGHLATTAAANSHHFCRTASPRSRASAVVLRGPGGQGPGRNVAPTDEPRYDDRRERRQSHEE